MKAPRGSMIWSNESNAEVEVLTPLAPAQMVSIDPMQEIMWLHMARGSQVYCSSDSVPAPGDL